MPQFAPFRRFAVHPSLSRIDRREAVTCVWFTDLRYDLPALPDTFRFGFCRDGGNAAVLPIFNTASLVGSGAVIVSLPGFSAIRDVVLGVAPDNPLVSLSIAVNVVAGITGSASGGMSVALQTLGDTYLELVGWLPWGRCSGHFRWSGGSDHVNRLTIRQKYP